MSCCHAHVPRPPSAAAQPPTSDPRKDEFPWFHAPLGHAAHCSFTLDAAGATTRVIPEGQSVDIATQVHLSGYVWRVRELGTKLRRIARRSAYQYPRRSAAVGLVIFACAYITSSSKSMSTCHTDELSRSYSHTRTTGPRSVGSTAVHTGASEKTEWPILPGPQFHSQPPAVHALR